MGESKQKERIKSSIEKFLMSSFDEVVFVKFRDKKVYLASDDIILVRTSIQVVADPNKILEGNLNMGFLNHELKSEIWNLLDTMFKLDLTTYGSEWDVEVYGIELTKI